MKLFLHNNNHQTSNVTSSAPAGFVTWKNLVKYNQNKNKLSDILEDFKRRNGNYNNKITVFYYDHLTGNVKVEEASLNFGCSGSSSTTSVFAIFSPQITYMKDNILCYCWCYCKCYCYCLFHLLSTDNLHKRNYKLVLPSNITSCWPVPFHQIDRSNMSNMSNMSNISNISMRNLDIRITLVGESHPIKYINSIYQIQKIYQWYISNM